MAIFDPTSPGSFDPTSTTDPANFIAAQKEKYLDASIEVMNRKVTLRDRLKKKSTKYDADGKYFVISLTMRSGYPVGSRGIGEPIPASQPTERTEGKIWPKYHYLTIEADNVTDAATMSQAAAWANVRKDQMKQAVADYAERQNMACHGDGTGALGVVSSYNAGVITLKDWTALDWGKPDHNINFKARMPIVWGSVSGSTFTYQGHGRVTAVSKTDRSQITITKTSGADPDPSDIIVLGTGDTGYHEAFRVMNGLGKIVSNADDNYMGVDTGDFPEWASAVYDNSGNLRQIDDELWGRVVDDMETNTSNSPEVIYGHHSLERSYASMLKARNGERFMPTKVKGGYNREFLTFHHGGRDFPIVTDRHAKRRQAIFADESQFGWWSLKPFHWDESNGGVWKWKTGYDAVQGFGKEYCELGVLKRDAFSVVRDLAIDEED